MRQTRAFLCFEWSSNGHPRKVYAAGPAEAAGRYAMQVFAGNPEWESVDVYVIEIKNGAKMAVYECPKVCVARKLSE